MSSVQTVALRSPASVRRFASRDQNLTLPRTGIVNPSAATSPERIVNAVAETPATLIRAVTPVQIPSGGGIVGAVSGAISNLGSVLGGILNFSPSRTPPGQAGSFTGF